MADQLLATKLRLPRIRPDAVPRPRLVRRFDLALAGSLTLISAPAGFGKTTALRQWVDRCARPVAWLTLDDGDNDPPRFWSHLRAALRSAGLGLDRSWPPPGPESAPPSSQQHIADLLNQLAACETRFALVLDDFHTISDRSVHGGLWFVAENLPVQMHLLVATRADPPWPLARMRAKGELHEVRAEDLRFTSEETSALLKAAVALELPDPDLAALEDRTEGWVAGLQMAAISIVARARRAGSESATEFVRAFAGSNRFIMDFLVEEVLDQQPHQVRDFLLRTAVLDRLTASLCDAVTERADGRTMLLHLERENLFIQPLDDSREWYRYHHLFSDLLRQQLRAAGGAALVSAMHSRASLWFESQGFAPDAIKHALDAHDWERAADLVQSAITELMERGEVANLLAWIAMLPDEVVRGRPRLSLDCCWPLILAGRVDAAEVCLEIGEKAGPDDPEVLGAVSAARAYISRLRGDHERTIHLSHQALSILPVDDFSARSVVHTNLGVAHWNRGEILDAEPILATAAIEGERSGNRHSQLTALGILGIIGAARGRLREAKRLCERTIRSWGASPAAGLSRLTLSALHYEWDDLTEAEMEARRGIVSGQRTGNLEVECGGYRLLAQILQSVGDPGGALDALRLADRLAREATLSPLQTSRNAAAHVQIALQQSDLAEADRWAEAGHEAADASMFCPLLNLTPARLLLARGHSAEAASLLARLHDEAESNGWEHGRIEVRVLQALSAERASGALFYLGDALASAEPEGYVRTFKDKSERLGALLRSAERQGLAPRYVSKLLASMDPPSGTGELGPPAEDPAASIPPLIEPLSQRELEVLAAVAGGHTNYGAALQLGVSVNTIKSHLKNINGKLGVHDRRAAVDKATALRLLR